MARIGDAVPARFRRGGWAAAWASILVLAGCASAPGGSAAPAAATAATDGDLEQRIARLDAALEEQRQKFAIPGMSVAIVKEDRTLLLKGYGMADLAAGRPVTPDTIFPIGSATKPMTTFLLATLAAQGRLGWDDHPRRHLPWFRLQDPAADQAVRLSHLVSHMTGLGGTDFAWMTGRVSREEAIRLTGLAEPTEPLGKTWQYQNVMFAAAGEIAGAAAGTSWEDLMRQRLFGPLGMTRSATSYREASGLGEMSLGYARGEKPSPASLVDTSPVGPAGSVHSTAADMAEWLHLLAGEGIHRGRRLLPASDFETLIAPRAEAGPARYGYGWFVGERQGTRIVGHGGTISGFKSQVAFLPDQGLAYAVLTNSDRTPFITASGGGPVDQLILSHLIDEAQETKAEEPPPPPAAPAQAAAHRDVLGFYRLGDEPLPVELADRSGRLVVVLEDGRALPLDAPAEGRFHVSGLPPGYAVSVVRDGAGKPSGIVFHDPARDRRGIRVAPYRPPMTAAELELRIAQAGRTGKAPPANAYRATIRSRLIHQGLSGEGLLVADAQGRRAQTIAYSAFGKCIAGIQTYFDGKAGGRLASFEPPAPYDAGKIAAFRTAFPFRPSAPPEGLFASSAIVGEMSISGEPVYIFVRTPAEGPPVTEHVSTRSYRIVERRSQVGGAPHVERYEDYRPVGGFMMPHRIRIERPGSDLGVEILTLETVATLPSLPAEAFTPGQAHCPPG